MKWRNKELNAAPRSHSIAVFCGRLCRLCVWADVCARTQVRIHSRPERVRDAGGIRTADDLSVRRARTEGDALHRKGLWRSAHADGKRFGRYRKFLAVC